MVYCIDKERHANNHNKKSQSYLGRGHITGAAFFLYVAMQHPLPPPQNSPCHGKIWPSSNHGSSGPPDPPTQTASSQPFSQTGLCVHYQRLDRQNGHETRPVLIATSLANSVVWLIIMKHFWVQRCRSMKQKKIPENNKNEPSLDMSWTANDHWKYWSAATPFYQLHKTPADRRHHDTVVLELTDLTSQPTVNYPHCTLSENG